MKIKKIDFCRKCKAQRRKGIPCESLDFVEAAHKNKVYPLLYCRMEISGHMDLERLKNAIARSCKYVPEILYSFDFRHSQFIDVGNTPDHTIIFKGRKGAVPRQWNLSQKPQLQVIVNKAKTELEFGISHILTDGKGFMQYLYLLAALYNDPHLSLTEGNHRAIRINVQKIRIGRATEQMKKNKGAILPLRAKSNREQYFCLNSKIAPNTFLEMHKKAKWANVTLNDIFLSAYTRVIAKRKNITAVTVPCPADLRDFISMQGKLSIANMTGIYRRIAIEVEPEHSFADTLAQVHIEMELQKSHYLCFTGIPLLNWAFYLLNAPIKYCLFLTPT